MTDGPLLEFCCLFEVISVGGDVDIDNVVFSSRAVAFLDQLTSVPCLRCVRCCRFDVAGACCDSGGRKCAGGPVQCCRRVIDGICGHCWWLCAGERPGGGDGQRYIVHDEAARGALR